MDIGVYDHERAKSKAKIFLEESIFVLSKMMDIDASLIDSDSSNPYHSQDPLYTSWECLRNEISALKKLR